MRDYNNRSSFSHIVLETLTDLPDTCCDASSNASKSVACATDSMRACCSSLRVRFQDRQEEHIQETCILQIKLKQLGTVVLEGISLKPHVLRIRNLRYPLNQVCNCRSFSTLRDLNQNRFKIIKSSCLHTEYKDLIGDQVVLARFNSGARMSLTSADSDNMAKKYKPNEIFIKTPYGRLAALEWGDKAAPNKILCMHGWLDNAGSFERLVPFILDHNANDKKYHIVALDQSGVGHSSHKPPGADYTDFSNVLDMRRVLQYLKWDKVILMSHSYGSHLSFLYCCVYPKQVEAFISIDLAQPVTRQVRYWNLAIANSIEDHFKSEYHHEDDPTTNIKVPVYSEIDAIKRLMDGHSNSLTRESAEVLLKRGAKKQRWGFTFNRDVRHRHLSLEFRPDDDAMLKYLADTFSPKLFIIRAKRSPYHRPEELRLRYYEFFQKNCPMFRDVVLDGTHHLHLNDPEMVSVTMNEFLEAIESSMQNIKSNL